MKAKRLNIDIFSPRKLASVLLIVVSLFCVEVPLRAQQLLTLDSAIAISLKNNYNILLAQNTGREAANSYSPGMAGMMPVVSANATYSVSANAINEQFVNGFEINQKGVVSNTVMPYLGLNWTLFDGTRMFAAYDQLRLMRDEGMENLKGAIQDNIASVIEAYYNIVMQKQMVAVNDSNLKVYEQEKAIAQQQYEVGMGSRLNFLQAEVSYNAQYTICLKQQVVVANSIISLNQLLELPLETEYAVSNGMDMGRELKYDSLKNMVQQQNPSLALAKTSVDVAHTNVREANALVFPSLMLNADYGLTRTQSNAGFVLFNQSAGLLGGGLTLSWNIFGGSVVNIKRENAKLEEMNSALQYKLEEVTVNAALMEDYKLYKTNLDILKLDEDNFKVAKENLDVALAQFRVGTTNIVQLQQAEASYAQAGSQVVTDRYNAKVSETQLLQLAALLAK
ncbi:MAG: TolC family protein [Bacteroidia bacterium]|nr:TolC family protein [Bacteroidia bacterium]